MVRDLLLLVGIGLLMGFSNLIQELPISLLYEEMSELEQQVLDRLSLFQELLNPQMGESNFRMEQPRRALPVEQLGLPDSPAHHLVLLVASDNWSLLRQNTIRADIPLQEIRLPFRMQDIIGFLRHSVSMLWIQRQIQRIDFIFTRTESIFRFSIIGMEPDLAEVFIIPIQQLLNDNIPGILMPVIP